LLQVSSVQLSRCEQALTRDCCAGDVCRNIAPKGATFRLFPADAPSAEALPLPRVTRDRSSSDPVTLSMVALSKRRLPPTPGPIAGSPPQHNVHFTSSSAGA